jgi:hypothetical protein
VAPGYLPTLVASATGTSGNVVASSAGQSIRVWQLLLSNSNTTATTATISSTLSGVANTLTMFIGGTNQAILPSTGVPWAQADTGTGVTFAAGQSVTVTAFYTKGAGG